MELLHSRDVFNASSLELEGRFARKRRFHLFNSWNLTEASHDSFVFISSAGGSCESHGNGCMKFANDALAADFSHFGIDDFPVKNSF